MTKEVRPKQTRRMSSWIKRSVLESRLEVGVVQDQDERIKQESARNRQALFLAAAQRYAPFANHRIVAVFQQRDKFVGVGRSRRRHDFLLRCIRAAVGDVVGNGGAKQDRFLEDHADGTAQAAQVKFAHVGPVDADGAGGGIIEAGDKMDKGALAGAGFTEHRNGLTRLSYERDVLKGIGGCPRILERDALEGDPHAGPDLRGELAVAAFHSQRLLKYFHYSLRAGAGVLDDVHELADRVHTVTDAEEIEHDPWRDSRPAFSPEITSLPQNQSTSGVLNP